MSYKKLSSENIIVKQLWLPAMILGMEPADKAS